MEQQLTQILVDILLREPFFGHLAANLLRSVSHEIADTALVVQADGTMVLAVNPSFWSERDHNPATRYGAIKHELLHLVLLHPFRDREFARADLYNIAADLVVNQFLTKEQLRDDQVHFGRLSSFELLANRSLGYYYRQLEAVLTGAKKVSAADKDVMKQWLQRDHPAQEKHQLWADALDGLEQEQVEAVAAMWQHQIKHLVSTKATASFYRLDEALREMIQRSLVDQQSAVDWKRVLRMFATNSRKMLLKDTIRRPSKRYGTVPGVRIKRHQRLMIALDTSGSLPAAMLGAFFREIHQLWRTGAELTIVECDDRIQKQYPYRGQKVLEVAGRGSTAFDPPIKLANESRMDGLIYLTDGFGPVPDVLPRLPVLWLIAPKGIRPDSRTWSALPGRVAGMSY